MNHKEFSSAGAVLENAELGYMNPQFHSRNNSSYRYFDEFGEPIDSDSGKPEGVLIHATSMLEVYSERNVRTVYGAIVAVHSLYVKGEDGKMHLYHKCHEFNNDKYYENIYKFHNEDDDIPYEQPKLKYILNIAKMMQLSY